MVVDSLWSGLEKYNPDTAKAEDEMAQSITTTDSTTYDIKIKPGWKFHDGTTVKADNFINAWNYGALKTNAQINSTWFAEIKGFDQVNPTDAKAQPTAQTLSGLKKVNDNEFTVTLTAPDSVFKTKLGYNAFYPMPDQFFKAKDKTAWAKNPVGNGPFKFVSYQPSIMTKVARFDGYGGSDKAQVKEVDFKIYQTLEAAYQDLTSGNLDFMEAVPPEALVGGKYKQDLQGRVLNPKLMSTDAIAAPDYLNPAWKNPDVRKAISMGIDRAGIAKQILNDTRVAMDGWVPDTVPGGKDGACGDSCKYNPTAARALMAKTGYKGAIPIQSNMDGGHKEPLDAVANSITKTFQGMGVSAKLSAVPTFNVMRQNESAFKMNGFWRSDWNFDYPSPDNLLQNLYASNGASNTTKYANPQVDALIAKGLAEKTPEQGDQDFYQAEQTIAQNMPGIPLWVETGTAGYSDKIKSVKLSTLKRLPDLTSIVLN